MKMLVTVVAMDPGDASRDRYLYQLVDAVERLGRGRAVISDYVQTRKQMVIFHVWTVDGSGTLQQMEDAVMDWLPYPGVCEASLWTNFI